MRSTSSTKRQCFINALVSKGTPLPTAMYIWQKVKDGNEYKPQTRLDYSKKYFEDLGISVVPYDCDCGYRVYQNGKLRPVSLVKTGRYQQTESRYHYGTYYMQDGKQKCISLALLLVTLLKGQDVNKGYCVDHIDNDAFNNDLDNLQVISIGENVKKDHRHHNGKKF